jgi:hypothetical protein
MMGPAVLLLASSVASHSSGFGSLLSKASKFALLCEVSGFAVLCLWFQTNESADQSILNKTTLAE